MFSFLIVLICNFKTIKVHSVRSCVRPSTIVTTLASICSALATAVAIIKPYMPWSFPGAEGWSGGAMVLGKLPVPGRPTYLDYSRARAYCACSRCGWGVVWTFFLSSITSPFFLPLSGRRPDID